MHWPIRQSVTSTRRGRRRASALQTPVSSLRILIINDIELIVTATESGIDEAAVNKYPGGEVKIGSAASGAGDNREIPVEEGGDISNRGT